MGAVTALLLIFVRARQASAFRLGLAGLLIFVGVFGVRLNIVIPALSVPVFRGFEHVIDSPRMASLYIPNWIEWLSSLGIIAAVTLLAYSAMRLLPMSEHQPCPRKS
jgi:Ni/Fe-hydrogenase subunit HybB-like protein